MSGEPQLFRIDPLNRQPDRIEEVDFASLGFRERRDFQEWVASRNPRPDWLRQTDTLPRQAD